MNQEQNVEQIDKQEPVTFGEYLLHPLPAEPRLDVEETRKLFAAVLNRLHITLGGTEGNQVGANFLTQAINATITAQLWTERALHYCDELALDDSEDDSEPSTEDNS